MILNKLDTKNDVKDAAFMGHTHALSALAVALWIIAIPALRNMLHIPSGSFVVYTCFIAGLIGASMLPDLDNTRSRAISDLGLLGRGLSIALRASSRVIQTILRTKYDDSVPDPHRGFWHSPEAAILTGFAIFFVSSIPTKLSLLLVGDITIGAINSFLVLLVMVHLALGVLLKRTIDRIKKDSGVGRVAGFVVSLGATVLLFAALPANALSVPVWVAVSVAAGMYIHDIGDAFTAMGTPVFGVVYNLVMHKRFWWRVSFLRIKAGGAIENYIFVPLFIVLSCAAIGSLYFSH